MDVVVGAKSLDKLSYVIGVKEETPGHDSTRARRRRDN